GMRIGSGWSLLFVTGLFLLCVVAAELWRSNSGEPTPPRLMHVRNPQFDCVPAEAASEDEELVATAPSGAAFDLGNYASSRSVARTAPPVASLAPRPSLAEIAPRAMEPDPVVAIPVRSELVRSLDNEPATTITPPILPRTGGEIAVEARAW